MDGAPAPLSTTAGFHGVVGAGVCARSRLAALALLGACASRTPEAFDQRMTTFIGRPEAELVAGLGVPSRSYEADGRRLLQWDFLQQSSAPAIYPSIGLGFGSFG